MKIDFWKGRMIVFDSGREDQGYLVSES